MEVGLRDLGREATLSCSKPTPQLRSQSLCAPLVARTPLSMKGVASETLVVPSATSMLEMEKKDKVKGSMRRVCEVKRENNRVGDIETKVIRKNNTICGGWLHVKGWWLHIRSSDWEVVEEQGEG
ncbi:hypothetical protein A2U01_0006260 [Trifolium medium]|uniref:Uncharacterized protein n=1 Tax=Trifolium medium TaxID=97028 RepID=A0A392MGP5_9FABA|nr:hypothetical protein [Trifolium medium]